MITKLTERNSTISHELAESMKTRISQRRSLELTGTLKYLHNHLKFHQEPPSDIFPNPSNEMMVETITYINKKYFKTMATNIIFDEVDEVTLSDLQQRERMLQNSLADKSIQEQLRDQIDDTLINKTTSSPHLHLGLTKT
ncbi:unnamed protein product [Parnassius apollo]|uniref:(apollo) hypothetical protein n=1 Tax=Parnassius apollo TaxID=110799 RepID=A0A8S3X0S1_PARAO|nr:unnamed protein product [Parnassius apollo]